MDEFIVFDEGMKAYVADIETVYGEVEYTSSRDRARIFRGETWAEFWTRDDMTLIEVTAAPMTPA